METPIYTKAGTYFESGDFNNVIEYLSQLDVNVIAAPLNSWKQTPLHLVSFFGGTNAEKKHIVSKIFTRADDYYQQHQSQHHHHGNQNGDEKCNLGVKSSLLNVKDSQGFTPLLYAAQFKFFALLNLAEEENGDPRIRSETEDKNAIEYLANATSSAATQSMKILIHQAQKLSETEGTLLSLDSAIFTAVTSGSYRMLECLHKSGAYLRSQAKDTKNTLIHAILDNPCDGSGQCLDYILDNVEHSHLKTLLSATNSERKSILHIAAARLNIDGLKQLMKVSHLIRLNGASDLENETPLHIAASNAKDEEARALEFMQILIQLPNLPLIHRNKNGQTALEIAVDCRAVELVKLLHFPTLSKLEGTDIQKFKDILMNLYKVTPEAVPSLLDHSYKKSDAGPNSNPNGRGYTISFLYITSDSALESDSRRRRKSAPEVAIDEEKMELHSIFPRVKLQLKNSTSGRKCDKEKDQEKRECDTQFLKKVLKSGSRKVRSDIFTHPVVQIFVREKWKRFKLFLYLWILFEVFAGILFSARVTYLYGAYFKYLSKNSSQVDSWFFTYFENALSNSTIFTLVTFCYIFMGIFLLTFFCKEYWQMKNNPRKYFQSAWNYFQFTMIFSYIFVLVVGEYQLFSGYSSLVFGLAALALFLHWIMIFSDFGKLPSIGKYMDLLLIALQNTLRILAFYSPVIIAFTCVFMILFPNDKTFGFPNGIIKTIVMMTGEVEYRETIYEEADVQIFSSVAAQLFMGVFVVLIVIVLLNLLQAVTITDIQEMLKGTVLRRQTMEIIFISSVEKFLMDFHAFLPKFIYSKILSSERDIEVSSHRFFRYIKIDGCPKCDSKF